MKNVIKTEIIARAKVRKKQINTNPWMHTVKTPKSFRERQRKGNKKSECNHLTHKA
jgi:hypothetical protein